MHIPSVKRSKATFMKDCAFGASGLWVLCKFRAGIETSGRFFDANTRLPELPPGRLMHGDNPMPRDIHSIRILGLVRDWYSG